MSSVFLLIFFIFVHYFFIEVKRYGVWYLAFVIVVSVFFEMFLIGFDNLWKILAVWAINLGIIFLIFQLDGEVNNRKIISSWSIFTSGVGIFSLFVAISYSFMFVGKYNKFNLTCDTLYSNVNKFMYFVSKPLKLPVEQVSQIKKKIDELNKVKVKDILFGKSSSGLVYPVLSGNLNFVSGTDLAKDGGIVGKIESLKYKLVDSVLKDKRSVDQGVCNFMINQIKQRYEKPSFKISVIVLLTLLFWPFLRFVLFIIGIINFILFKLLNLLKIYNFVIKLEEVEDIE